jgi:hypothetical protein
MPVKSSRRRPTSEPDPSQLLVQLDPPILALPEAERAFLDELGTLVPGPREAKRLANTYALLRSWRVAPSADEDALNVHHAAATLLALQLCHDPMARRVLDTLHGDPDDDALSWLAERVPSLDGAHGLLVRAAPRIGRLSLPW